VAAPAAQSAAAPAEAPSMGWSSRFRGVVKDKPTGRFVAQASAP
jgi:hypothetical protein